MAAEPLPPTPECEPGLYCPFTDNGAYHGVCLWHEGPERTCTCDGTTHQPATAAKCDYCGRDPLVCKEHSTTAASVKRVWRTVYRRQRDLDRHPGIDPARLPVTVYSSSDVLTYQRDDLAYLRSDDEPGVAEAWIETRIEHPWERTDD